VSREVFDRIAPGWYNYRHWSIFRKELETVARRWKRGNLVNIGCAHGPDFLPFRDGFQLYGMDFSSQMLNLALKYSQKFEFPVALFLADARHLPFSDDTFDYALSVATYHHIKGDGERKSALSELYRVLKPGGEAFITVWNRWQPRFWFTGKEPDIPWKIKDETLYRYYYLFSYPEMKRLVKQAGFRIIRFPDEPSYLHPLKFFSRNICLLVRKGY
jgi:tRNA (uracil-5-)-methyltransferase TRM9